MAERNFDEEFDYDTQEGHSFVLGGFTFHTPPVVAPGAFLAGGRGLPGISRFLRRAVVDEERANLERVLEMPDTSATLLDAAPRLLAAATLYLAADDLNEGKDEATAELRKVVEEIESTEPRQGPLVSAHELDVVADWLMEVTIGRPTKSSSPSGNGAGRTSAGSKATSSKPAKAGKS